MTAGSPVRLILAFALPVLAGNGLQQLYNVVDSLIVGRLLGVTALAAVSASGWLDWAVLSIPMGLAQGFSIQVAQAFGAKDGPALRRSVGQSLLLAALITAVLEAASQAVLTPALRLINTPEETFPLVKSYLRIIYAGLPLTMALNVLSGFLHALGNSKTPLVALAVSTLVNIALDVVLIRGFGMGTDGGAVATVCAQGVSALICFVSLARFRDIHPTAGDLRPDVKTDLTLMRLGFPLAFQNLIIALGGLVLQTVVNGFGFVFMAGYNAASRLQGMVEMAGASLGNAVSAFTGQNVGARRLDRVRSGLRASSRIGFLLALVIGGLIIAFGKGLLSLFIRDEETLVEQVLTFGYQFLVVMACGLPMLYLLFVYRSTLQGSGNTLIPMVSGFVELGMRIGCALLLPALVGVWGLYFAEIAAWIGAAVLLIVCCYRHLSRLEGAAQATAETAP